MKYLGITVTNQNMIEREIKRRMHSGNVLLPFTPEPSGFSSAVKNIKIKIHKTIILPLVLYGCEIWSLTI
jgi:hypothetical protein